MDPITKVLVQTVNSIVNEDNVSGLLKPEGMLVPIPSPEKIERLQQKLKRNPDMLDLSKFNPNIPRIDTTYDGPDDPDNPGPDWEIVEYDSKHIGPNYKPRHKWRRRQKPGEKPIDWESMIYPKPKPAPTPGTGINQPEPSGLGGLKEPRVDKPVINPGNSGISIPGTGMNQPRPSPQTPPTQTPAPQPLTPKRPKTNPVTGFLPSILDALREDVMSGARPGPTPMANPRPIIPHKKDWYFNINTPKTPKNPAESEYNRPLPPVEYQGKPQPPAPTKQEIYNFPGNQNRPWTNY